MSTILITTSSFAINSKDPLDLLKNNGYKILLNNTGQQLKKNDLIKMAKNAKGIIAGTETYDENILKNLPGLRVISRIGVGTDNVDLNTAHSLGIKILKNQTTPAPAVSELVLGLMIDVSRKISQSNQLLKNGSWKKQMGSLLQGKTLGIIGLGTIGKQLVQLSRGFQFNILAFDQQVDNTFAKENNVTYCGLEKLLKGSDIVSIHLNLSEQTKFLIDQEKIKLMKPEAILINTSRGEIIDENALYVALKNSQLAGAGLDVFEHEPYTGALTELDNVVLTPHIGAYAKEIRIQMEIEATENLIRRLNEV